MAAYLVFVRRSVSDPAEMSLYQSLVGPSVVGRAMRPLVRYGECVTLEGAAAEGAVVIEFPDMAAARDWYESDAYQAASVHRHRASDYDVLLLDGVPGSAAA